MRFDDRETISQSICQVLEQRADALKSEEPRGRTEGLEFRQTSCI